MDSDLALTHGNMAHNFWELVNELQICNCKEESQCNNYNHNTANDAIPEEALVVRAPTGFLPCLEEFPGPFGFGVEVQRINNRQHGWQFSAPLNKVFIDMGKYLPIKFSLKSPLKMRLLLRAFLVYSEEDHLAIPVERCTLHSLQSDPKQFAHAYQSICRCTEFNLVGHVITTNHRRAQYDYDMESGRHSVLVQLEYYHNDGSESTNIVSYQFNCKNSCVGGMDRRPVNLVFTLETQQGEVVGRSVLQVKVSSNLGRDRLKEEEAAHALILLQEQPRSRRRPHSSTDTLPNNAKAMRMADMTMVPNETITFLLNASQQIMDQMQGILETQLQHHEENKLEQERILTALQELSSKIS